MLFIRIYGDKAGDIIEGLKKNPAVAVPLVLKRLVFSFSIQASVGKAKCFPRYGKRTNLTELRVENGNHGFDAVVRKNEEETLHIFSIKKTTISQLLFLLSKSKIYKTEF